MLAIVLHIFIVTMWSKLLILNNYISNYSINTIIIMPSTHCTMERLKQALSSQINHPEHQAFCRKVFLSNVWINFSPY